MPVGWSLEMKAQTFSASQPNPVSENENKCRIIRPVILVPHDSFRLWSGHLPRFYSRLRRLRRLRRYCILFQGDRKFPTTFDNHMT